MSDLGAKVSREVSVDQVDTPESVRYIISFSIELPQGHNNFEQVTAVLDEELTRGRNEIINKIAKKLGVGVNFVD